MRMHDRLAITCSYTLARKDCSGTSPLVGLRTQLSTMPKRACTAVGKGCACITSPSRHITGYLHLLAVSTAGTCTEEDDLEIKPRQSMFFRIVAAR